MLDWLDDRKHRAGDAHVLHDLFGVLKAQRLAFANPLTRIHVGSANPSTPAALTGEALHAGLHATGAESGFWDDDGRPAP
ncbi:hypothetical protein [Actinoplanes regularis]|uniref:Uncharacterized protein n=1 Tax=Actinoplanes regularis TaxID=52697 RepID=A0A239BQP6_9ACTN|nr:hypothetical protein [Actinoplanes regularis]GIE88368.1 hypothetical protein Are01nite_48480 [Actinoplanes regularis]SNS09748.1 hypothetical protein SAMN06264365_11049 [Actinoplanes regularis]